jgi:hypothetical protein
VYFIYNAGYWISFGGGTLGPRFFIPALPFLALGLACAYRRMPALTIALAIPSVILMTVGTLTFPLIGEHGVAELVDRWRTGALEHTVLTVLGVSDAWLAVAPVLLAVAAAAALAVVATPRTRIGDIRTALKAVLVWAIVATIGPTLTGDPVTPLNGGGQALSLIAFAACLAMATLLSLRYWERRREREPERMPVADEPVGEPIS